MAQFCVNENTGIDIVEVNGAYYATLWVCDLVYNFGPAYDITNLIHEIHNALKHLNSTTSISASHSKELDKLNIPLQLKN